VKSEVRYGCMRHFGLKRCRVRTKLGGDRFSGPEVLSLALLERVMRQLHVQSGRQESVARVLGGLR
jgi:hypothetical protein